MAKILFALFALLFTLNYVFCDDAEAEAEQDDNRHRVELRDQRQLALYPRVGKRSPGFQVMRRRDFLNFLADSWQKTGSLRGAIHEIQDMTESKRELEQKPKKQALVFPAPRVGKSDPEMKSVVETEQNDEISKKWAMARMGKKWAAARIGKKSNEDETDIVEPEKRVPFARVG